jgi:Uma2 family endonuclease
MVATPSSGPSTVSIPPGDLYSDEPTMETDLHLRQMLLLISCLDWLWQDRNDFFASGNLTIYFSPKQIKSQDFRGPDFFVVLGTEKRSRKSWVVWEEDGKYPNVIVEILSDSTAETDRETKKEIYQNTFRTPEYFWFNPDTLEFAGFLLVGGVYEPMEPNQEGRLWSRQLGLYLGIEDTKLRFFTSDGELVPTPEEAAKQAQQQVQQVQQQVQQVQRRANCLAEKLRELGVDPNTV